MRIKLAESLFGVDSLGSLPAFEVLVRRYESDWIRPELFYSIPTCVKFGEAKGYGFGLAGFQICAKLDNRRWPLKWRPFIVNGNDTLRGLFVSFESTGEFGLMRQAALAQKNRDWS
jgi:hypothetical protein